MYSTMNRDLFKLRILTFYISIVFFSTQTSRIAASNVDFNDVSKTEWIEQDGKISVFATKNNKDSMEDRFFIKDNIEGTGVSIFAVFDGHGGKEVAEYANKALTENIMKKIVDLKAKVASAKTSETNSGSTMSGKLVSSKSEELESKDSTTGSSGKSTEKVTPRGDDLSKYISNTDNKIKYDLVLTDAVLSIDGKIHDEFKERADYVGTTVSVGIIDGSWLVMANSGDSRVLYLKDDKPNALTTDHKPDVGDEKERIEHTSGLIVKAADQSSQLTLNGHSMSVSRALGDFAFKRPKEIVLAYPYVNAIKTEGVPFVLMATDGLWDYFNDEDAVNLIKNHIGDETRGTKEIVKAAISKQSTDNITAIVVKLN